MPDDAIALVRRIYDAFAQRDFAAIGQLIDPNIEIAYEGVVVLTADPRV